MILNTKTILEEVNISVKSKNPNPLVLKEQKQLQDDIAKENKLQSQVAMLFKDSKYYKTCHEVALTTPENETPQQRDERIRKENLEAQLKNSSKNTAINAGINVFGKHALDTTVSLAGKGISAIGKATGYWS